LSDVSVSYTKTIFEDLNVYSRVLKDVFIVKNVLVGAFYVVLNDVLVHFFYPVLKIKKPRVFPLRERLGITTVGMPGHGFTFPVGGIYRSSYF
jgi:hypothetical protein